MVTAQYPWKSSQAAHESIFKAMDADKDGTVSREEMMDFMRGTAKSPHDH